jgi:hypothetical protein
MLSGTNLALEETRGITHEKRVSGHYSERLFICNINRGTFCTLVD